MWSYTFSRSNTTKTDLKCHDLSREVGRKQRSFFETKLEEKIPEVFIKWAIGWRMFTTILSIKLHMWLANAMGLWVCKCRVFLWFRNEGDVCLLPYECEDTFHPKGIVKGQKKHWGGQLEMVYHLVRYSLRSKRPIFTRCKWLPEFRLYEHVLLRWGWWRRGVFTKENGKVCLGIIIIKVYKKKKFHFWP